MKMKTKAKTKNDSENKAATKHEKVNRRIKMKQVIGNRMHLNYQ